MQISLTNLDFIYANNKVRARLSVQRPEIQWGGHLTIEVTIDHADSIGAMKAAAVAAAKEFLSQVVSEINVDMVAVGPHPPAQSKKG